METEKLDFWDYLAIMEVGKWYNLRSVHGRLLQVCEGFEMEYIAWVSLVMLAGKEKYEIDIQTMKIKKLNN